MNRPHRILSSAPSQVRGFGLIVVSGLIALTLLVGCHNYYDTGLEALLAGNLSDAEQEAREGLREEPSDPGLNLLMARVLMAKESWAKARGYADRAVIGLPDSAMAHLVQGQIQAELGATVEAADQLLTATELDPTMWPGERDTLIELLPKASVRSRDNDLPGKTVRFIEALQRLDPSSPEAGDDKLLAAREALGTKLTRIGRYEEALALYGELMAIYPDRTDFMVIRGATALTLGQDDDAEALFARYVKAPTPDESAARMEDVGQRASIRKRDDIAERYWLAAIEQDPKRHSVYTLLATLRFRKGRTEEAYQSLRDYLDSFPGDADPRPFLAAARTAVTANQGEIAIEILKEGNRKARPNFLTTAFLCDILARRSRRGDVEEELNLYVSRYVEAGGPAEQAQLDATNWLERHGEFEAAVHHAHLLLKVSPQAKYWLLLARLEVGRKHTAEMTEALEKYIAASRKEVRDFQRATRMLIKHHQISAAERIAKQARAKFGADRSIADQLASVYRASGSRDKELAVWRSWIATQPDKAEAALSIGRDYVKHSAYTEAAPFLEEAAKNPRYAGEAYLALGESQQRRGNDREAREIYEKYLKLASNKAEALETLLDRYRAQDQSEEALKLLAILVELRPDNASLRFEMGRRHLWLTNTDSALEAFKAYVNAAAEPMRATRKVGKVLRRSKRPALALEFYEWVLTSHPPEPALYAEIGDLYWDLSLTFRRSGSDRSEQLADAATDYYTRYIASFKAGDPNLAALPKFGRDASKRHLDAVASQAFARARKLKVKMGASDALADAKSQLALGRFGAAEPLFALHLKRGGATPNTLYQIGTAAFRAGAYELAMKMLRRILDSGNDKYARQAFDTMSQILIRSGQRDKLIPLGLRIYEITQAPFNVRKMVAAAYMRAGLWDAAITEYRDLVRMRPNHNSTLVQKLAEAAYLAGDSEQAGSLFADSAKASSDPTAAWISIGRFYLSRGELDRAREALSKGGQGGAEGEQALWRGVVFALGGDREQARASFRASVAQSAASGASFEVMVDTLLATGDQAGALDFAQQGAAAGGGPLFQKIMADIHLSRGDEARGLNTAKKWAAQKGDFRGHMGLLTSHGYNLRALGILRQEIDEGDPRSAETALFKGHDELLRLALEERGADRLPALVRPLFEATDDAATLHENMGLAYARIGRPEQAGVHLSAASMGQGRDSDLVMAQQLAARGRLPEARAALTRFAVHGGDQPASLYGATELGVRVLLGLDDTQGAETLVRTLMARPGRDSLLVPLLVEVMLAQGRRPEALDLIRDGRFSNLTRKPTAKGAVAAEAVRIGDFLQAIHVLAGFGYVREAYALLSDVVKVRQRPALLLAAVELGTTIGARDTTARAKAFAALGQAQEDPTASQLRLADAYLAGGDPGAATPHLMTVLSSRNLSVATRALSRLVTSATLTGDDALLQHALETFHGGREDKAGAYLAEASTLRRHGLFALAAIRYSEASKLEPGAATNRRILAQMQYLGGRLEGLDTTLRTIRRGAPNKVGDEVAFGHTLSEGPDARLASSYWAELGRTYPGLADVQLEKARATYLLGDPSTADTQTRELVATHLGEPVVLESIFRLLVEQRRWDTVMVAAKTAAVDDSGHKRARVPKRTPLSYYLIGVAAYELGERDVALANFDRYLSYAPDSLDSHLAVAESMLHSDAKGQSRESILQDAKSYLERLIDQMPGAAQPYLVRGLIRLELRDLPGAVADFERTLKLGDGAALTDLDGSDLVQMSTALLGAGAFDEADPFVMKLAHTPTMKPTEGIRTALSTFAKAGAPRRGLRWLTKHYPLLARTPWLDPALMQVVADLYGAAGDLDRARSIYRAGMARFPRDPALANGFASLLIRSGGDLTEAEALARRSLAFDPTFGSSMGSSHDEALDDPIRGQFMDTLAAIHHRQGDDKAALAEELTAIRLQTHGGHSSEASCFTRLAEIYEGLGMTAEAAGARRRAARHETPAFESIH